MKNVVLRKMLVGEIETNCYVLGCASTKEGVVIDPGGNPDVIKSSIEELGLTINAIINTHGHVDHIGANAEMKDATRADLLIHEYDAKMLLDPMANLSAMAYGPIVSPPADRFLAEGDSVKVGTVSLSVLHTPGHTAGGICLLGPGFVFVGDTLFAGSIGRTDFPGGSLELLVHSIRAKLLGLPGTTTVLPGHGPNTTIQDEKKWNPFV